MISNLSRAYERGIEEARQEGMRRASIAIIKNMRDLGMAFDLIVEVTELSEDEVKKILDEI